MKRKMNKAPLRAASHSPGTPADSPNSPYPAPPRPKPRPLSKRIMEGNLI